MVKPVIRRDTPAWIMQTWLSFVAALILACFGIYYIPVDPWQRGFVIMALFFSLGSTFSLAKSIRDNRDRQIDTAAWVFQVWSAFAIAVGFSSFGIYHLPVETWVKGYAAIALLFVLTTAFTLAKTIRDNQEAVDFDQLDRNGDGSLSRQEVAGHSPKLVKRFDALDRNGDGKLTPEELRQRTEKSNS